jgi:hypothetical protein
LPSLASKMVKIEAVEPLSARPLGTYEVKASGITPSGRTEGGVVFVVCASSAAAECNYIVRSSAIGGLEVIHREAPLEESWQANPTLAHALENVIVFRPEQEDVTENDIETLLPRYPSVE